MDTGRVSHTNTTTASSENDCSLVIKRFNWWWYVLHILSVDDATDATLVLQRSDAAELYFDLQLWDFGCLLGADVVEYPTEIFFGSEHLSDM